MPSDAGDRRSVRGPQIPVPEQPEQHLACPRCDSTNTKFCYFNNYNLSQPRHFCKSCRRYWTQGGALRDIPVGGGTRSSSKAHGHHSNKRSRTTAAVDSTGSATTAASFIASGSDISAPMLTQSDMEGMGSFSSLLATSPPGFLALGEPFLSRTGFGLEGMGFGLGRGGVWSDLGESGGNTWQAGIGDGFSDGDCFPWPDLAISMPGSGCLQ